jgi:hypothetical protein
VDEVKDIRDKARAIEMYTRQAQNTEAERQACEIRLRAERKCGELLNVREMAKGTRGQLAGARMTRGPEIAPPLADLGISYDQSSQWQKLAAIPGEEFEADLKDPAWRPTTSGMIDRREAREHVAVAIDKLIASKQSFRSHNKECDHENVYWR